MTKKRSIKCPTCQKKTTYTSENKYRPFCSERCKLIDFGAWATEEHTISEPFLSEELLLNLDIESNKENIG